MNELRVTSIQIRDVLGVTEASITPGKVTVLTGHNGSTKTSVLQAVQAALGRGSLAKLGRITPDGEPGEPEVCLVLENATEHYRVERTGEKVRVQTRIGDTQGYAEVPRPVEWLSALVDTACANPVAFLTAPDKQRALLLLEALPLSYSRDALLAEMGLSAADLREMAGGIPTGLHPLQEIGLIHEAVFRARTGVNRDQKQQQASAEQLRRNLPAALPKDRGADIALLETSIEKLQAAIATKETEASGDYERVRLTVDDSIAREREKVAATFKIDAAKLRREHEQRAAEARRALEESIAKDLAAVNLRIEDIRALGERTIDGIEASAERTLQGATEARNARLREVGELRADLTARREELAQLRGEESASVGFRALQDQADAFDLQTIALREKSERLTDALEALDAHRRRLADNLPIPGLAINGTTITVHGVPFEQLNTAQKVEIAVKVATLRAAHQRLPLVWVDNAEALDSAHFAALVAELQATGTQAFIAKVTDGPLLVEAVGETATA